jgi:hypothetical protein
MLTASMGYPIWSKPEGYHEISPHRISPRDILLLARPCHHLLHFLALACEPQKQWHALLFELIRDAFLNQAELSRWNENFIPCATLSHGPINDVDAGADWLVLFGLPQVSIFNLLPWSLGWKAMTESTVYWFVVREKTLFVCWKYTTYKPSEEDVQHQMRWCRAELLFCHVSFLENLPPQFVGKLASACIYGRYQGLN